MTFQEAIKEIRETAKAQRIMAEKDSVAGNYLHFSADILLRVAARLEKQDAKTNS